MAQKIDELLQEELKLDKNLKTPEARTELVKKIIEQTPEEKLTSNYLRILADYICYEKTEKEKAQKKIITDNRRVTLNMRQTSFEGLVSKFECGEDSLYNMIISDKNVILSPKSPITEEDIEKIPELKKLREDIEKLQLQAAEAVGKRKYLLKKQIIELRKDQYVIRSSYKPLTYSMNLVKSIHNIALEEKNWVDEEGNIQYEGISFLNPKIVEAFLCNYEKLKTAVSGRFDCDAYYAMLDLDELIEEVLKYKYPIYYDLLVYKTQGRSNEQIQLLLEKYHGVKHSSQYISSLWRKKIPKMLAEAAQLRWLDWYYTEVERGKWKKCSRCGKIKLANNLFFSKNSTSKDGFYSICKCCRNAKNKKKE